jgi:hypothetical protein
MTFSLTLFNKKSIPLSTRILDEYFSITTNIVRLNIILSLLVYYAQLEFSLHILLFYLAPIKII